MYGILNGYSVTDVICLSWQAITYLNRSAQGKAVALIQ